MEFGKKTLLVLRFFHHKVLVRGYVGRKGQDALMPNAWPLCRFLKEIDHIKPQKLPKRSYVTTIAYVAKHLYHTKFREARPPTGSATAVRVSPGVYM